MVLIVKLKSTMQKNMLFCQPVTSQYSNIHSRLFHSLKQPLSLVSFIFHSPFKIPKGKLYKLLSFQGALSHF